MPHLRSRPQSLQKSRLNLPITHIITVCTIHIVQTFFLPPAAREGEKTGRPMHWLEKRTDQQVVHSGKPAVFILGCADRHSPFALRIRSM